jgi:hypothetical protein
MAASTGPMLAAGAIVIGHAVIVLDKDPRTQTRVVVATLIGAGGLALLESGLPQVAVGLAWLILIGVLLVPVDPTTPAPLESFDRWYRGNVR